MTSAAIAQLDAEPARAPRRTARDRFEALAGIGFAMPAFVLLVLTNIAPLFVLLVLSFTNSELGAVDVDFIGLQNFRDALADSTMRTYVDNVSGLSLRRIKHFSGFTIETGKDDSTQPATP